MLTTTDLSVIAMLWLTLADLGYMVADLDLTEPGFVKRVGPHTIYSFAILLRDDDIFPEDEFSRTLDKYSAISTVKPHCYSIEKYDAHCCTAYDPTLGTYETERLKNFHSVYISVFV